MGVGAGFEEHGNVGVVTGYGAGEVVGDEIGGDDFKIG